MTSFIQIPTQVLDQVGGDLRTIAGDVETAHGGAGDVGGLDPADHGPLISAVATYRTHWDAEVAAVVDTVRHHGDQSTAIGRLAGETDETLAAGLRP
jgi:hypothetical protein